MLDSFQHELQHAAVLQGTGFIASRESDPRAVLKRFVDDDRRPPREESPAAVTRPARRRQRGHTPVPTHAATSHAAAARPAKDTRGQSDVEPAAEAEHNALLSVQGTGSCINASYNELSQRFSSRLWFSSTDPACLHSWAPCVQVHSLCSFLTH